MQTIVVYSTDQEPINEYPTRIVSPPAPSACCAGRMERVGDVHVEGINRYVYVRCSLCGFTVRQYQTAAPFLSLEEVASILEAAPVGDGPQDAGRSGRRRAMARLAGARQRRG